jgi:prevent-host-death family protein
LKAIGITQAKANLSRLVDSAAKGEPFIIAKAGKPMVKVVPLDIEQPQRNSRIGFMRGEIKVPDDFDTMMQEEIEEMFYGTGDGEDI